MCVTGHPVVAANTAVAAGREQLHDNACLSVSRSVRLSVDWLVDYMLLVVGPSILLLVGIARSCVPLLVYVCV